MKIQLKKLNKTNRKQQLDFSLLKNNSYAARYNFEIRNRFNAEIDYTKTFDRVNHTKLIECLKEIGVDDKDLKIIIKMYWEQTAVVRTKTGISSVFKVKKGVRQGCVLSPNLYNLYTEKIFREIEGMPGAVIRGVNIANLRYTDDNGLSAIDSEKLQDLINTVDEKGKEYGMSINIKKT